MAAKNILLKLYHPTNPDEFSYFDASGEVYPRPGDEFVFQGITYVCERVTINYDQGDLVTIIGAVKT
jgi:hypothetical protein